jgi:PadR family transcriptional regulator PadR
MERVISDDHRVRVYYSITESGREYLSNLIDEYRRFSDVVDTIMRQGNEAICKM